MDLDRGLLAAALREKEGFAILQKIPESMIMGDAKVAHKFMRDYFFQHKKMPSYQLLNESTGIDLFHGVNLQEPSGFFIEKIRDRTHWLKAQEGMMEAVKLLEHQGSLESFKSILSRMLYNDLRHEDDDTMPRSIFSDPSILLDDYSKARNLGVTGIETPWPSMNRLTMGWQKEEFSLFVARPGQGKTWVLLVVLFYAWQQGAKVILFSTEMSIIALKRRAAAILTRLSYGLIKAGRLPEEEFLLYKDLLSDHCNDSRFLVVGNDTSLKRSIVEQTIIMENPDMVGIDGFYMFEDDIESYTKDEIQKGAIWKTGKKIAKRYKIPFLATHQLNRPPQNAKPGQKPDLTRLANSDAAGQYADFVFSIRQTEEMRSDKKIGIVPIKTRDAEFQNEIELRWDLSKGLYHEIDKDSHKDVDVSEIKDFKSPPESPDIPF